LLCGDVLSRSFLFPFLAPMLLSVLSIFSPFLLPIFVSVFSLFSLSLSPFRLLLLYLFPFRFFFTSFLFLYPFFFLSFLSPRVLESILTQEGGIVLLLLILLPIHMLVLVQKVYSLVEMLNFNRWIKTSKHSAETGSV
jgi:hypothetical protein